MNGTYKVSYRAFVGSGGIASRVAVITVAFAVAAVILAVSIANGFREAITSEISSRDGELWLECRDSSDMQATSFPVDTSLICNLMERGAQKVEGRLSVQVIVLTEEGSFPLDIRSSSTEGDGVAISRSLAERLNVKRGDDLSVMYSMSMPLSFPLVVDSVYESSLGALTESIAFADHSKVAGMRGFRKGASDFVDGYAVWGLEPETVAEAIGENSYWIYDAGERYSGIYDWLDVIDGNVWLVAAIMIAVASINMLAAALVLILENAKSLAVLKSLGMPLRSIRFGLVLRILKITSVGALLGLMVSVPVCMIQDTYRLLTLPGKDYMVDFVPMSVSFSLDIMAAMCVILLITLVSFVSTVVVESIKEEKLLRYE